MASLVTDEQDVIILKAGWIFRQKPLMKKWRKSWGVVSFGGNLKFYSNKRSSSTQKMYNVKRDLLMFKIGTQCRTLLPPPDVDVGCLMEPHFTGGRRCRTLLPPPDVDVGCLVELHFTRGRRCRTLLPPPDVDVGCLMELHFTGGRRVCLCAHDLDSASLWVQALTKAQSEKALPTPRYSRKNRTKEDALKEESEEQNKRQQKIWYKILCCGGTNQVKDFTTPRQPTRSHTSWT